MPHQSDSAEQHDAELLILKAIGEKLGRELTRTRIDFDGGSWAEVDGVDPDETVFVEAFAHHGLTKAAQKHKVARDALKLITLARTRPDARLIIAFADDEASRFATQRSWVAAALAAWGVQVMVVELDAAISDGIRTAQIRQKMVNPEAPTPAEE
jgi:hypothetical protein